MSRIRRVFGLLTALGMAGLPGCDRGKITQPEAPSRPFAGAKIAVAAVGDPAILKTVIPQRGEWQRDAGGRGRDPRGCARAEGRRRDGRRPDLPRRPPGRPGRPRGARRPARFRLATAAGRARRGGRNPPDAAAADPFAFDDVLPAFRDQVTRYGEPRMALPYGGSALVLAYRRDAFAGEANLRAAAEAGLKLEPPTTWEQLDALAKFFQGRDWDGDGSPDSGLALALGPDAEGLGEAVLLARAAGEGLHPDQFSFLFDADTMAPRIALAAVRRGAGGRSLRGRGSGRRGSGDFDAEAARRAFRVGEGRPPDRPRRAGRGAGPSRSRRAASGWPPCRAPGGCSTPSAARSTTPRRRIGRAYLPGGGGWLIGVSSKADGDATRARPSTSSST